MFEYDICWCADSNKCTNKDCFRHLTNKPDTETIFTCSNLIYTELCPLEEKGDK